MNKIIFKTLILALGLLPFSCQNNDRAEKNLVTKRIQYDVLIRNMDPDMDWWVQNIEGSSREKLISDIIKQVSDGKVKAYDFFNNQQYSAEEIHSMMKRTDTISIERSTPPYDLVDTIMVTELNLRDISKIRFLEEWRMDNKTLAFTKKIAGICPMLERRSDSGELRGYKPLFWVFFDDKYPAK